MFCDDWGPMFVTEKPLVNAVKTVQLTGEDAGTTRSYGDDVRSDLDRDWRLIRREEFHDLIWEHWDEYLAD